MAASMPTFEHVIFDLDGTLYQVDDVPAIVRKNIEDYMVKYLKVAEQDVSKFTSQFYASHGTTLAGLVANGYDIDFDDWHAKVHHTLQYDKLLFPDAALRSLLSCIRVPKYILTNADSKHTDICLEILGIRDCFDGIFHFENINQEGTKQGLSTASHPVVCKPAPEVYELVLQLIGAQASTTLFLDDSMANVVSARSVGISTVLVGKTSRDDGPTPDLPGVDFVLEDIHLLPDILPHLFEGGVQKQPKSMCLATDMAQEMIHGEKVCVGSSV